MSYKSELPVKYCLDCEFHFHAPPKVHCDVYHEDDQFRFVRGDYKKAQWADSSVVRAW